MKVVPPRLGLSVIDSLANSLLMDSWHILGLTDRQHAAAVFTQRGRERLAEYEQETHSHHNNDNELVIS